MSKMKDVQVTIGQNIIDLAIQYYGGIEGMAFLMQDNDIAPGYEPTTNEVIRVRENTPVSVLNFRLIENNNITISTGLDATVGEYLTGDDNYGVLFGDDKKPLESD